MHIGLTGYALNPKPEALQSLACLGLWRRDVVTNQTFMRTRCWMKSSRRMQIRDEWLSLCCLPLNLFLHHCLVLWMHVATAQEKALSQSHWQFGCCLLCLPTCQLGGVWAQALSTDTSTGHEERSSILATLWNKMVSTVSFDMFYISTGCQNKIMPGASR